MLAVLVNIASEAMAVQVPMAGTLGVRAGLRYIIVESFFGDATMKKSENMHQSCHIFYMNKPMATALSVLKDIRLASCKTLTL